MEGNMPFSIINYNSNYPYMDVLIEPVVLRSSKDIASPVSETLEKTKDSKGLDAEGYYPHNHYLKRIYGQNVFSFNIPVYNKQDKSIYKTVKNLYISALNNALISQAKTICISVFSEETSSYPKKIELNIVTKAVRKFLRKNNIMVYLRFNQPNNREIKPRIYNKIDSYLGKFLELNESLQDISHKEDINEASRNPEFYAESCRPYPPINNESFKESSHKEDINEASRKRLSACEDLAPASYSKNYVRYAMCSMMECSESSYFDEADISFNEALIQLIGEKGLKDSTVYNNANIDRRHFSKIIRGTIKSPRKQTVLALAISMKLNLEETNSLLNKAGLSLTNSNRGDLIVKFHITNKVYDIYKINIALHEHDQYLLGSFD